MGGYTAVQPPTITEFIRYYSRGQSVSSKRTRTPFLDNQFRLMDNQFVASTLEDESSVIGGSGITVEIDECKLDKRKYHRGHSVEGVWIVGVERTNEKRIFIERVENRSAETSREIIARRVAVGSIICTDMWRGYQDLESLGMSHDTVNHSEYFRDPGTGVLLPDRSVSNAIG
jgi:ISXO2-like transposase domain